MRPLLFETVCPLKVCSFSSFEAVCPLLIFDARRDGTFSLQGLAVSRKVPACKHGSACAFGSYLVHNMAFWNPSGLEALECCRELTRNTLLWLGESEDTRCLVTFWIQLTTAIVMMGGMPGW